MSRNRNIKRVTSKNNVDKKTINSENKIGIKTSKMLEKEQDKNKIAKYGFKNAYVELRYDEKETYRTNLRRQRDKILYTGGFRRLQDKTQVLSATKTGDHRTRLTHTLEVEQIAISIADALGLNKDLVSAIALGHDVGHTPFGHAAERTLNELLENNGGFHHPIQSVKYLWLKYGDKIEREIYEGILKHDSDMFTVEKKNIESQINYMYCNKNIDYAKDKDFRKFILSELKTFPSTLEAQVVIWADKIAYITHDLEDYMNVTNSSMFDMMYKKDIVGSKMNDLKKILHEITKCEKYEIRDVLRCFLNDLIKGSINILKDELSEDIKDKEMLKKFIKSTSEKRSQTSNYSKKKKIYLDSLLIHFSNDKMLKNYFDLRKFLDDEYILSNQVQRSDAKAYKIITELYNDFVENKKLIPMSFFQNYNEILDFRIENCFYENISHDNYGKIDIESFKSMVKNRLEKNETNYKLLFEKLEEDKTILWKRVVVNYISTMSDSYASELYSNLNAISDKFTQ